MGHTGIHMLGRTIRRGESCRHAATLYMYTYIEPCACVFGRDMQILYL